MHDGGHRAIWAALAASLAIAVATTVGFVATGAVSVLAVAAHAAVASGTLALLLVGLVRARPVAGAAPHPLGYGRERSFWAFVVAVVLSSVGGAFVLVEGATRLRHPHEVRSPGWAVGIVGVSLVVAGAAWGAGVRQADLARGDAGWVAYLRRSRSPELPLVVLAGLGAVAALVLGAGGVVATHLTGNPRLDAAGSIAIGLLLVAGAVVSAAQMRSLLIGTGAGPERLAMITDEVNAAPSVTQLLHVRTEHLGPDELLVAARVEFARHLSVTQLAVAIDEVARRVRAAVPEARLVYLEPDVARSDEPA